MTSLYNEPERLAKNSTNLSNLTKGIGELSNEEKKYDIIIEENDYYGSMGQKKALSRTKQEINLPKTFTTKKGALILFSEDLATYKKTDDFPLTARFNEQTKSDFFDEEIPIKTVNELQQNVLIYGFNKNMKLPEIGKTDSKTTSDSNYLGLMSTKNLISKSEFDTVVKYDELSDLKKINRGYSARRYLRNLTKNWDQDLLDTFISDGKLNEETIYEKKATKRKRAEEDLTILPQAYTFDQNWVSTAMDKRNLNFFNDFGNSKSDSYHFKIKKKSADKDPITIFKKDEQEISYDLLDQDDKQKVLSDLLFHSVMNNINQHQIGDPINSSISYTREGVRAPEKIEIHIKNFPEIIFDDASSDGASDSMLDKLNSDSDGFQKSEKSRTSFFDTVPKKTTLEPIYMFGKHSGAPWIKKQTENNPASSSIASDLKSDSKILKPNSKIRKQLSKDEVIKDELSPRSSDEKDTNIQESKTIRTKFDADLVQQEFKTIDEMFEIAAQDYGLIEKSKEDVSLSKEDEPDQDEMKEMYLDEIRSIQEGYVLEDVSHLNLAENRNLKSASTNRSYTKNKSILKTEKALEIKTQKNEVRFEKLPEKNQPNQQSSNWFINEKIQNKDPNETKYKPDVKARNSSNDLEKHSVRVITVNNKKKTYKVDPKILKDMEHFGIKKFERFDTKKYDRQREKNFTDNSTNSKASWTNKDTKFEASRPKGSALSDEKWNYLNTEESFHPNSAEDNVAHLAESFKRPLKPKIESVQQQNKLPKLKFLKSQDFHSESLTDYKQSSANSDSAYFDSDFAKVEMLRLRPKQNGGFAENFQSTKKERKELTSQMPNQTAIYNFEEKEPYNPKKYDYSNILFKETTNLNRKDNNYLKPTSFKGLPSAEHRNEINTQRDPNVSTKTKLNDNLKKRTINWAAGDFDPREFFMLWSYESPPAPIVVDRTFADTLRKYAEFIAKNVLNNKHAGMCLSDDIKRALRANLERLKQAIAQGKISREVLDEYKNIFKQVLAKTMKRKDLENVEIDDEMLMKLLELPARAFEVYIDPITGKESLRIKSAFLREQAKVIRTIVTEKPLSKDDFDEFIDPKTGEKKLKLRQDVAKKLGIPEDAEDLIEFFTDENGNQVMRLKDGARNVTIGDTIYELVTDADGKQVLKMTTKQKVGEEKLDDILRLADNMSPEAKNRYLQDLLKTGGGKMNDEIRKKLIDEMIKNAENLTEEAKENFLKDLMVNLVNELPPNVAKKVLSDIMKSTDGINTELKQQMIKNLIHDLNDLPEDLKEQALMELMKNMDNLSSEAKNNLLQDILTKVEETGGIKYSSQELRNQVLKEMLKNSQNLDEETRNKILHQVLDKITAEDGGDVPPTVLEELVKQMYNLPDSIKSKVLSEVTKNLEQGNLDSHVLSELLKHSEDLAPEILAVIIKNTDKMESSTLKELVKHLDKIPDEFKQEIIGKMVNNLDEMDSEVKQELLKELMANPDLIQDEKLREKVLKDILSNLKTDDVIKETENMTAEEKNKYLQDLLKHSDNLSEETRQQIIGLLIKNAENLDQETKNNFLKDLIENIKELPPDLANKVLGDLMKNTNLLDADLKQKMIENLLNNLDDLPDELKQTALNEIAKNLDNLSAEKKEEIFKTILNNLDSLPDELKQETFKTLIDNMNNLSSDQKNTLLQNILDKVEDDSPDNEFKKNLKNEVLKEIVKNSQNLDEEQRTKILKDVMQKLKPGETVPDSIMNELVKQIDDLPDEIKSHVLNELKNSIENGNISGAVLDQMMKNPKNLPKDLLQKVVDNLKNLAPDALQKFVENLDSLPEDLKNKAVQDMLNNMDNIDPNVKKDLLKELVSKPGLIKDKKMMEKAIMDLVDSLEYMPENVKKDMLKDLAKNINNLSGNVKEKIIKEVFKNLTNSNDETREEIMKQLMKKMGADELEKWLENSDLPEEFKAKVLADIEKIRNEGEDLLNSDDEKELEGLSGEERAVMKRRLIEKRKQIKHVEKSEKEEIKRDLNWLQNNKDNVLKNLVLDPDNSEINLNEEQIDFVRAFHKLSEEEKTKLLENMSEEERKVLTKLTEQYHDLRQKELQEALSEAKNLAIQKLRERLALQKRMEYLNFLKLESKMFDFAQQISRAFVFSYFEMLQWLEISF